MTDSCRWPLGNGSFLEFKVYDSNTGWNDVAGLYIFAYSRGSTWYAHYVGQTTSLQDRLPCHERWLEAVANGTTHIHALSVSSKADRDRWEQMLIKHLQPPMNDLYRQTAV